MAAGAVVVTSTWCYIRAVWLITHADRKLQAHAFLWAACGTGVVTVAAIVSGNWGMALLYGPATAWSLWEWWNRGGGDGMKKLLKKAAGYLGFGPQAAPQGA